MLRQPYWGLELGPVASTSPVVDNEWLITPLGAAYWTARDWYTWQRNPSKFTNSSAMRVDRLGSHQPFPVLRMGSSNGLYLSASLHKALCAGAADSKESQLSRVRAWADRPEWNVDRQTT
jgi:hypothetical protein